MRAPLATLLLLPACFGDEVTEFPPGLEPIEPMNLASFPPIAGDRAPEEMSVLSGHNERFDWVHGRGFLHGPIERAYAALQVADVLVDRRNVAEWSSEPLAEPGFSKSLLVHNEVHDVLTVTFDVTYRYGVLEGSEAEPELVAVRFQKTFGTSFIEILEGSMLLRAADDGVVELEFIEHIQAALSGEDRVRQAALDLHASAAAWLKGQALPAYE